MTPSFGARRWPTLLLLAGCVGLALPAFWSPPAALAIALGVLAGAVAIAAPRGAARLLCVAVALGAVGLAWGGLRMDDLGRSSLRHRVGESASARLVVTSPGRPWGRSTRVFADIVRFGSDHLRERVLAELPDERAPPRGAIVEIVRARLRAPRGPETGFDERAWLTRRGISVVARVDGMRVVGRRGGIGGVADRLRAHVEHALSLGVSGERRALLRGIVLGDDGDLGPALRDDFRASGLAHLTAVSGQNVAIVALGLTALSWLVAVGRLGAQVVAVAGILGYALAVGWEPSVARATVAGTVACVAVLGSRRSDGWHALVLGAVLLLAWRPTTALDPGFQLSFAAVAAILVTVPRVQAVAAGYPPIARPVVWAAVALACSVATAPIVWLHFGYVAVWSVPANVAAEPAMPLVLGLALTGAILEPVLPEATTALSWLAGEAAAWIAACARLFARLPQVEAHAGAVVGALVVGGLAVWWVSRLPPHRRRQVSVTSVAVAIVLALAVVVTQRSPRWVAPSGLRVTFLDVGQGDAVLLEAPGAAVLVDEGPPEARVDRLLRDRGITSLSALVLTHPQRDHVGGAADVIRSLAVERVLEPGLAVTSEDRDRALSVARERGSPVSVVRAGDEFTLGRLRLRVLWPSSPGRADEDPNENAIVLLASFGRVDVLLTADAESNVTARLPLRSVEVLKVAHHGSEDRGLPALLRVLRPTVAVVSVGRRNEYGHPREETLAALRAVPGLRLLRTDRDGDVVIESDGRRLTISRRR